MMCARHKRATPTAWNVAIGIVFLMAITLVGANDLAAQRPSSTSVVAPTTEPPDFLGSWSLRGGHGFDERVACAGIKDPFGTPMQRCSQPWDKVKDYLNKRGLAWMEFVDEAMSTKHVCAPATLPALLDAFVWTVYRIDPAELRILYTYNGHGFPRSIWMDGRKHPSPSHLFYQGDSIGWYEGDELVVETTNFTFDPDGLEDHLHIPSSSLKKLTERYKKTAPDRLRITFTHEDPMFLKRPWTWTWEYQKVPHPEAEDFTCDRDAAQAHLKLMAPSKYDEK